MSRTILLEQIVALELGSEVRERLELIASYKAVDGFSIDFSFEKHPACHQYPLNFEIFILVRAGLGANQYVVTNMSFTLEQVPLITAEVARRGDMEIYYRRVETETLEYLAKLRAILVEPFLSPMEKHLLETAAFNNDDLINLELDQLNLEDWPHEPQQEND